MKMVKGANFLHQYMVLCNENFVTICKLIASICERVISVCKQFVNVCNVLFVMVIQKTVH